jgi:hypothetical protein
LPIVPPNGGEGFGKTEPSLCAHARLLAISIAPAVALTVRSDRGMAYLPFVAADNFSII